jgi:hypothetical protein
MARLLAALDVHPRVAMRILRHSKIAVTMEIYTEPLSDATRDALRSSATGSHDRCCRLLLPEDQKGPVPRSEPAFDLRGAEGIRTPDPLHAMHGDSVRRSGPASCRTS